MLDFLACQSAEKLVVDAEGIAMAKRLLAGIEVRTETLATALFEGINFKGDFLKQKITRELFAKEQYLPSSVIDRESNRGWLASGSLDTFDRAKIRVRELLESYKRPENPVDKENELQTLVASLAMKAGMEALPKLE